MTEELMPQELLQIGQEASAEKPSTGAAEPGTGGVSEPVHEEPVAAGTAGMINIRNLSVKCGYCGTYQTLMTFSQNEEGWNVYTFECEDTACLPEQSRTMIEIPGDLDEYAHRDPTWRGGAIHGGAG